MGVTFSCTPDRENYSRSQVAWAFRCVSENYSVFQLKNTKLKMTFKCCVFENVSIVLNLEAIDFAGWDLLLYDCNKGGMTKYIKVKKYEAQYKDQYTPPHQYPNSPISNACLYTNPNPYGSPYFTGYDNNNKPEVILCYSPSDNVYFGKCQIHLDKKQKLIFIIQDGRGVYSYNDKTKNPKLYQLLEDYYEMYTKKDIDQKQKVLPSVSEGSCMPSLKKLSINGDVDVNENTPLINTKNDLSHKS